MKWKEWKQKQEQKQKQATLGSTEDLAPASLMHRRVKRAEMQPNKTDEKRQQLADGWEGEDRAWEFDREKLQVIHSVMKVGVC